MAEVRRPLFPREDDFVHPMLCVVALLEQDEAVKAKQMPGLIAVDDPAALYDGGNSLAGRRLWSQLLAC